MRLLRGFALDLTKVDTDLHLKSAIIIIIIIIIIVIVIVIVIIIIIIVLYHIGSGWRVRAAISCRANCFGSVGDVRFNSYGGAAFFVALLVVGRLSSCSLDC